MVQDRRHGQAGDRQGSGANPRLALDTLAAILRLGDQTHSEALRPAMKEGVINWRATLALADRHLLLPALWPALTEKKLAEPVPLPLRQFLVEREWNVADGSARQNVFLFLEDQFAANAARNRMIRGQLGEIIGALNAAGIVPGLIKGARLLLAGDWRYVAGRTLRDIDLLIEPGDWSAGLRAIGAVGYRPAQIHSDQPRQGAAFVGPGPADIDLHVTPLTLHEPVPLPSYLTAEGFWERAATITDDGLVYRLLPPAESLAHGIIHTEIADLNYTAGDWALRYLHETAVLSQDPACDWSVLAALAESPLSRPVEAHLLAARDLFGAALPKGLASSPAASRQFRRCRRNITHPRSWRRCSVLAHKFRQAMSEWYLRRTGYIPQTGYTRAELWRGRLWVLRDLLRIHGPRLLRRPFGGDGDPLPPPRV